MEQDQQYQTPPQPQPPPPPVPGGFIALSTQNRPRGRTACSGCSKRKIRCDAFERVPCTNCAKRGHHDMCTFDDELPRSGTKRSRPSDGDPSPAPRVKKDPKLPAEAPAFLDGIHNASAAYTQPSSSTAWSHSHTTNGTATSPSYPAQKAYNVTPTYSSPYQPYHTAPPQQYSRPSISGPLPELTDLLPSHKTVLRYFDVYKAICHPIYLVITDLEDFENAVCRYVEDFSSGRLSFDLRSLSGKALTNRLSWFALLTAAVATGVQYSDMPAVDRDSLCARYLRNATEILRMADYMGRPDENCIAAMLLISRTMENDLMPEAAWSSLGLIGRMSELVGLHSGTNFDPELDVRTREQIHLRHRKLWWSYLWAESAIALCFGKTSTPKDTCNEPPISTSGDLTYNDCMLLLCRLAIRARPDESLERSNLKAEIEALATARHLHETALPRLSNRQNCRTIQDRIEYYSLRISQGFIVSCMSQTLMKASIRLGWDSQRKALQSMCKEGALDCLQAFVDMQSFSIVPLRTWMFIFSALASALVLAAVGEDAESAKVKELQRQLLGSLAERDREMELPGRPGWFARYPKAVQLLREVSGEDAKVDKEKQKQMNGRESGSVEHDGGDVLSERRVKDLLDPATLWDTLFSVSAGSTSASASAGVNVNPNANGSSSAPRYPTQSVVVGT